MSWLRYMFSTVVALMTAMSLAITPVASANTLQDYNGESRDNIVERTNKQVSDCIKSSSQTKPDLKAEAQKVTLGETFLLVCMTFIYGWMVAFIMPGKVAELMRGATTMGCVQYIAEYINGYLN